MALSKLVSKLDAGSRILDKNEFRVSRTSVDTSIDNLKRNWFSVVEAGIETGDWKPDTG